MPAALAFGKPQPQETDVHPIGFTACLAGGIPSGPGTDLSDVHPTSATPMLLRATRRASLGINPLAVRRGRLPAETERGQVRGSADGLGTVSPSGRNLSKDEVYAPEFPGNCRPADTSAAIASRGVRT